VRVFRVFVLLFVLIPASRPSVSAQPIGAAKQPFVDGLIKILTGISGTFGDERTLVTAGLAEAEKGLRSWDGAITQYREGVSQQLRGAAPQMAASLHAALGAVYLDRGRVDEAIEEFSQAVMLDPGRADAFRFRALAYEGGGNTRAAAADFARAWSLDRRDPAAAYLSLFYRQAGEPRSDEAQAVAALETFARQRTGGSTGPAAPFVRLSLLEERQSTDPVFLPALYADAARQLRRRRYEAAVTAFQRAWNEDPLNKDPAGASMPFLEGAAALRDGRWADAIQRLESAARGLPSSSEVRRMRATTLWLDDQADKAVTEFRAAIAANPRDERSRIALADLFMATRRPAEAERVMAEAIAAMPESGQAHWRLGRALEQLHRDADARQARERAIAIGTLSGESRALNAVVREYRNESDVDKAIDAARARVAADLNDATAHDQLGQVYQQAGRDADALIELVVATLLDPSRPETHARLAQVYLGAGRYAEAIEAARRALAGDANNREARFALGRSLQLTGKSEEAAGELAAAERLQLQETEKLREVMATNLVRTEALLREQQGKWEEAAALRRDVTAHAAAQPSDFTLLGEALSMAGRHVEAIEAFRAALDRDSQPEIYQGLVREFTAAGRPADAEVARAAYERVKRQRFLESVQGQ
jgi:tetratricopeptide (TPR) repeat protein